MLQKIPNKLITTLILVATFLIVGCPDNKTTEPSFIEDNYESADVVRGGLLYDKWWKVNGGTEPTTDFALYPSSSAKSGNTTWRCKECHGWDYIGKDGRYSSGSHYTGIKGIWDLRNASMEDVFDAIKGSGTDHDLSAVLSDKDIADLTKFVLEGLVDVTLYLTTGDANNGQGLYEANCKVCHGTDGNTLDFEGDEGIQGIGFLADDNPHETFHKIRFGNPGTQMPSMFDVGLTNSEMADILAYGQSL